MADPGLIMMVKEKWPETEIHLSVQANTTNWATVKFWQKMGVARIILSRELSLDEIEKIRQECPDMELEVFVHGALCIAYSGRCLLSGYFNRRDPNQGTCTNACRWDYKTHDARGPQHRRGPGQTMDKGFNFKKPRRTPTTSSPAPAAAAPPQGRPGLPARRRAAPAS
jgi:putative protease